LRRKVLAEASVSFDDCQRQISSRPGEFEEITLSDDPIAIISILAKSPATHREILDDPVKVSEQTEAVLDHLESAKRFLQNIMDLGAFASELHPIAKAIVSCIHIVYDRLKDQKECNQLVLDLAKDMACTLGYIEDVKQFSRLAQLKQAIRDVTPLMEETTNFIVEFPYDGRGS